MEIGVRNVEIRQSDDRWNIDSIHLILVFARTRTHDKYNGQRVWKRHAVLRREGGYTFQIESQILGKHHSKTFIEFLHKFSFKYFIRNHSVQVRSKSFGKRRRYFTRQPRFRRASRTFEASRSKQCKKFQFLWYTRYYEYVQRLRTVNFHVAYIARTMILSSYSLSLSYLSLSLSFPSLNFLFTKLNTIIENLRSR